MPGDTGGSDDPTPLVLPSLGLAKRTVGLPVQSTGSQTEFDVTYQIVLENTGNVTLTGLDMYDDVATEYGLALVGISAAPNITAHTLAVPANLPTLRAGWSLDTTLSMFNDDGSIAPGETITVEMTLTLDSRVAAGTTLLNQARVVADDVASGGENGPSDLSDDGTDPDGVNSGSPGDTGTTDDPTPVVLPNSTLGVAKDSQWDDTLDTATFTFRIEHFGSSTALNLSLTEDLDAIFALVTTLWGLRSC